MVMTIATIQKTKNLPLQINGEWFGERQAKGSFMPERRIKGPGKDLLQFLKVS